MKYFIITLALFNMYIPSAFSATFNAVQGDVLRIEVPQTTPMITQAQAFGKTWPIYKHEGKRIAWIGVHLKTKIKKYPLIWSSTNKSWSDDIQVIKGSFRISHIKVKKNMASFDAASLKRIRADQRAIKKAYKTAVTTKNTWPEMIQPVEGIVSTPFAAQRYVNGEPRSPHSGLDIAAPEGTSVRAPLNAKVLLVSDMYLNGTLIALGHGDGLTTIYAHLKHSLVQEGQELHQGDIFAEVGSTGRSTGPHLHWGVHFSGAKINPKSMLKPTLSQTESNKIAVKENMHMQP